LWFNFYSIFVPHFQCHFYFINVNWFLEKSCIGLITRLVILPLLSHVVDCSFIALGSIYGVLSSKSSVKRLILLHLLNCSFYVLRCFKLYFMYGIKYMPCSYMA